MKERSGTEIEVEIARLKQKPQLDRRERRYLAKLENKLDSKGTIIPFDWKNFISKMTIALLIISAIGGIILYLRSRPSLPPIDLSGHIEQNPPSHILDEPMPEPIQKHMLEHADGKGKPGIIIQYNCNKPYTCETNLVNRLKSMLKKYPENVYLAPGNYNGLIILTKLNERKILNRLDEKIITEFISGF